MPIYEYECGNCCYRFEMRQEFDDNPEAICPQCHSRARRVFHPTAIIFKGSGFYITDSRKSKEPAKEPAAEADKKKPVPKEKRKGK